MYRNVLCLVLGLVMGIRLTNLLDFFMLSTKLSPTQSQIQSTDGLSIDVDVDVYGYGDAVKAPPLRQQQTETQLAAWLHNETRVLCFVLTMPLHHRTKAARVKATWGKRCNKLIFMSTDDDVELGAVKLNVREGRQHLYEKVRAALTYIYERYLDEFDWFLKADDDTYVIMENLRMFLYPYDTEQPVYFGCKFRPYITQGYMSGGAGYVLSRDAVRRFNLLAKNNTEHCKADGESEDKEIGLCLQNVGVVAGDSRDEQGRERFLPLAPRHLLPKIPTATWLIRFLYYMPNITDCCSDTAISFHYVKEFDFDIYEYFIYNLHVFGMANPNKQKMLPLRLNATQMKLQLQIWANATSNNKLKAPMVNL